MPDDDDDLDVYGTSLPLECPPGCDFSRSASPAVEVLYSCSDGRRVSSRDEHRHGRPRTAIIGCRRTFFQNFQNNNPAIFCISMFPNCFSTYLNAKPSKILCHLLEISKLWKCFLFSCFSCQSWKRKRRKKWKDVAR